MEHSIQRRVQPNYLVDQVLQILQKALENDELQAGDKLPSETSLAKQYGVSRSTIREALRVLSHLGLVETWAGKGSFVVKTKAPDLITSDTMNLDLIKEIYEFRYNIEAEAAEKAALYRTEDQLSSMKSMLSKTKASFIAGNMDETVIQDTDFHISILKAAGCNFAVSLYESHRDVIEQAAKSVIAMPGSVASEHMLSSISAVHDDLLSAIEVQDAHAALVVVRRDQREVSAWLKMKEREQTTS
ncbi:FadR/GntR family transcriptional regulator [Kordiimonas pumila]|uniref:FadR/GntR family transcriptional regulator n=1 Tax=Kordiimonas pumila TaxID=2161677 RepID=A0ABV7D6T8_9PROT|nr:GntR family transcriptional regulator [Kordiimonas pumila]